MRIINEPAVTTLANADKLLKDNPSTGVAAIAWSDLMAQIQALFLTNGKLSSNLVPSSFAGGISYKGTVAGASVPASSSATGDYYLISSAGTSQAITWAVGDFAVWNGAAWQQVAMNGAYITPTQQANLANPRAPRQGLVFDGTAGAPVTNVPAFGTGDFTVLIVGRSAVAFADQVMIRGASAGGFLASVNSSGNPYSSLQGTGTIVTATGVLTANKGFNIAYTRSGGVGTWYINGAAAGSGADASNYSVAINGIGDAGTYGWNGFLCSFSYNRALSASEVLALYEQGRPAASDYNNAGNTSLITGDDSTFASDTGFWTKAAGVSVAAGVATFPSGGGSLTRAAIVTAGKRYRCAVTVQSIGSNTYISDTVSVQYKTLSNGANVFEFVATTPHISIVSDAGTVDTITLIPIGLLVAPDAQQIGAGMVWTDQSGNGAHIVLPASGVAWALPGGNSFHVRGTTSTNGNQQLLGAICLPANCQITRVRARARTNTPTITIGTASGGAQIVASVALSTTWKDLTIALTGGIVSSASSVWIGSNSTDVVEIDITAEPLSF